MGRKEIAMFLAALILAMIVVVAVDARNKRRQYLRKQKYVWPPQVRLVAFCLPLVNRALSVP